MAMRWYRREDHEGSRILQKEWNWDGYTKKGRKNTDTAPSVAFLQALRRVLYLGNKPTYDKVSKR